MPTESVMKSSEKLSAARKGKAARAGKRPVQPPVIEDEAELSPAEIKELRRRVRDSRNPIRYMLVSEFTRRFVLYYNISDDVFAMNDPSGGTLFKRREAAESVKKLLSSGVSIVKYTTKGGKLKRLSPYRSRWTSKRVPKYGRRQAS